MDVIVTWTEKIATKTAPDEIDQAPFVATDFVKGGRDWKAHLRSNKGGVFGGFDTGVVALLPHILEAIRLATPFLTGLLTAKTIDSTISIVKILQEMHNRQMHKQLLRDQRDQVQYLDKMIKELHKSGRSIEECETIIHQLIELFREDPKGSVSFLHAIAGNQ